MFGTYKSVKEYSLTLWSRLTGAAPSARPGNARLPGADSPAGAQEPKVEGTPV
jgi:hypothetical protein